MRRFGPFTRPSASPLVHRARRMVLRRAVRRKIRRAMMALPALRLARTMPVREESWVLAARLRLPAVPAAPAAEQEVRAAPERAARTRTPGARAAEATPTRELEGARQRARSVHL